MALDVGDARIGVALSDPLGLTASPYLTIERKEKAYLARILEIITRENVKVLLIGLPRRLDGSETEQTKKTMNFIEKFKKVLKAANLNFCEGPSEDAEILSLIYWDERLSTQEAEHFLVGSKLKDKERSRALDKLSAALMLDTYLLQQK